MNSMDDDSPIEIICHTNRSAYFDEVIGHIEDIVLSMEFEVLRSEFLEAHWQSFEDTEENKLEYMDIFSEYTSTFEHFIVDELKKRMADFDMDRFAAEFSKDDAYVVGFDYAEILELLYSLTDFETFKELMIDYRSSKERKLQNLDFDSILITKPISLEEELVKM